MLTLIIFMVVNHKWMFYVFMYVSLLLLLIDILVCAIKCMHASIDTTRLYATMCVCVCICLYVHMNTHGQVYEHIYTIFVRTYVYMYIYSTWGDLSNTQWSHAAFYATAERAINYPGITLVAIVSPRDAQLRCPKIRQGMFFGVQHSGIIVY